jgi:hypothetical protein
VTAWENGNGKLYHIEPSGQTAEVTTRNNGYAWT